MNQFFVEQNAIRDGKIIITGDDVKHISNVLKLRIGEEIQVVALNSPMLYQCEIEVIDKTHVDCVITDVFQEARELPVEITLYQGLPKGDKLEFVIQKAVEMGAVKVVPVAMKRSVMKIDPKKAENKQKRWQAIAESAASQSKRLIIPEVASVMSYKEAIKKAHAEDDVILVPYELAEGMTKSRRILEDLVKLAEERTKLATQEGGKDDPLKISVFVGPEGGFDDSEIAEAKEKGAQIITLGRRILRTETAPIAILAWLTYLFEV